MEEINGERNGMCPGRSPKTRESERKEKPQLFKSLRDLIGGGKGSQLWFGFILVLCRRSSGSPNFQLYTYCDMHSVMINVIQTVCRSEHQFREIRRRNCALGLLTNGSDLRPVLESF